MVKLDILGRRIPVFDRSAAGKKAMATQKEIHGNDYPKRIGANGGRHRKRGNFGKLKDEGKETELREISQSAAKARWKDKEAKPKIADRKNKRSGGGKVSSVLGGRR